MKTVAVVSGGLDSTVLLYWLLDQGHDVRALSVNYGQRHITELAYAKKMCKRLSIVHEVADLSLISNLLGRSSQTDPLLPVPEGHYAEESMKLTVVPNRNALMLSVATAWAISMKADNVAYGAHAGDHTIYPDCRAVFASAMDVVMRIADWHEVGLLRPFVNKTKAEIVSIGAGLSVPFECTWSCYNGRDKHCSVCGTCVERREAFRLAGVEDPTEYEN